MKIRDNQLSFSAWKAFLQGPDSYVLYLMGLELRAPAAAKGKDWHKHIATALMGGNGYPHSVDAMICDAKRQNVIRTPAGVEVHLQAGFGALGVHGHIDYIDVGDNKATIVDWKTGQPWPDNEEQIRWYCLMAALSGIDVGCGCLGYVYLSSKTGKVKEVVWVPWDNEIAARTEAEIRAALARVASALEPREVGLPVHGVTMEKDYPRNIAICQIGDTIRIEAQEVDTPDGLQIGKAFMRGGRRLGWVPKELIHKVHAEEAEVIWMGLPIYQGGKEVHRGGLRLSVPIESCDY